jgi:hypothetical protein
MNEPGKRNWYGDPSPMTSEDWANFDEFRRRQSDLTVVAIDDAGTQMYPVLSLEEAREKFDELCAVGSWRVLIKHGNSTIRAKLT